MKKNITMILAMCLMAAAMTACGGSTDTAETTAAPAADTTAAETEAATEAAAEDTEAAEEEDTEAADEEAADEESADEESGDFTLLDVTSDMIDAGVYAVDENQNELVFTMFTEPSGTSMASLFIYAPDGTGDVICGEYTAEVETDEDNITWTSLDVSDVYTGNEFTIGFAESEDDQVYIIDTTGTVYEGQYLSADDTIVYMGTAVALLS